MPMIVMKSTGEWRDTSNFLDRMSKNEIFEVLTYAAEKAIGALASATPIDTGLTADCWYYTITHSHGKHAIVFHNSHVNEGQIIAILLQYGHGTRNGGYVVGRDYINPVIQPIFDELANSVWKEVTK